MTDTALNYFLAYGTAAARGAFTPSVPTPASGPGALYIWYETDTGNTYVYASGSWSQSNVIAQTFSLPADISPAQITADQNDYNPAGLSTATVLRLNSDASHNITGLAGGADGRAIFIANIGAQDIVLKDESASSSAANRFALDGDLTLGADTSCILLYDSTSSRWRLYGVGKTAGGGGGGIGGSTGSTDNAILRADGTGGATLQNSLITISDTGALGLPDGVRQTFNPDGTNAGLNVGAQAGDPSSLSDGDVWYNSSTNQLMARSNGASIVLTPAMVLVSRSTPTGTGTVTVSSGLSGFRDILVVVVGRSTAAATNTTINLRLNNDSGSNYDEVGINSTGAAISTYLFAGLTQIDMGNLPASTAPAGVAGGASFRICNANDTNLHKVIFVEGGTKTANATTGLFPRIGTAYYRSTSAITRVDVALASGNFDAGSVVSVYGVY